MSEFCVLLPIYGTSHLMQPMLDALEQNQVLFTAYSDGDAKANELLMAQKAQWQFGQHAHSPENRGLFYARRAAWEAFKYNSPKQQTISHVLNLDPDDEVTKDFSDLMSKGCNWNVDVVEFNAYVSNGQQKQMLYRGFYDSYLRHYGPLKSFLDRRMRFSIWTKLIRRSLWENICKELDQLSNDWPHLINGEDIIWTWMLASRARSWRYYNYPVYNYRMHAHSASNSVCFSKTRKKFDDIISAHRLIRQDLRRQSNLPLEDITAKLGTMRLHNLRHSVLPSFNVMCPQEQNLMFTTQERHLLAQVQSLSGPTYVRYTQRLMSEAKALAFAPFSRNGLP